jgi:MFS family permease
MARTSQRNALALDALNFFLADVRDGLGPYLAIYLLAVHHWEPASIGLAMTLAGLAALVTQTPAGALIDRIRSKRGAVAISLGLTGPKAFTRRTGRNETWNHAGNACAALLAGVFSYFFGPVAVFYLMAVMALLSVVAVGRIEAKAIDHDVARGFDPSQQHQEGASGWRVLLSNRSLMLFGACCALFHLANAAMLPLVSQKLAQIDMNMATPLTSACIVAAQLVMVPAALLVGARADHWGRKPLLLAGFAILPIRGVLYTLSDDAYWLVAIQMLDGIGAGLFGALFPLVVKDLVRGSGRFNVSLGALTTVFGLGAALSNSLAGFVVQAAGYSAAFLTLAAVAGVALLLLLALPETLDRADAYSHS